MMKKESDTINTGKEIAVIGMAGRFPGAAHIGEFWENLKNGIETISFFPDKELEEAGVNPDLIQHPDYVKSRGLLENKEYFDAEFFGYSPLETEIMNPQMRILHECTWEAFEDAGYEPGSYDGLIGFYTGTSSSSYWEALTHLSGKTGEMGEYAASHLNDKDYTNATVSYNLNLKGPVFSLHTACSTSLVAIHVAYRALLTGECKMALAGGITVSSFPKRGYLYREGMIMSPDGHCRAFDAKAKGTIGGEGVGLVLLKRLKDAISDGDNIYAVIKGTAINNDGRRKVGFTAPSVEAQAEVIRTAQRIARVEPGSIGYIEAHGTGTTLGDPVEIEALTLAFATDEKKYCAIGSVKTNVGHLDIAAGVTGFIKTVLALKYKLIPPNIHFETPNPGIDFENTPFYVNARLAEWKCRSGYPRRAGVSALGIGGTNAHVILEEAPAEPLDKEGTTGDTTGDRQQEKPQLIVLSAKTGTALEQMTSNLAGYFKKNPRVNPVDAAYTLQVGRKAFPHREILVCTGRDDAIDALSTPGSEKLHTFYSKDSQKTVFMFPGQGAQYVNMGLGLYEHEPVFRGELDRCFDILAAQAGYEIKKILYPSTAARGSASDIDRTGIAQPLIFVFEYALAKTLLKWGIQPWAMLGHSIGEYTAACIAGVFSLADAIKLIVLRGKLMQEIPPGAMLSVSMAEERLHPLLNDDISLAAVNSSTHCVVSGTHEAVRAFEKQMLKRGCECQRLHTSHAFHSKMMDPVVKEFAERVKEIKLHPPEMRYISNVSGDWITAAESTAPSYWAKHLRCTVRFSQGLDNLLKNENSVFVEVGPGKALATFARQHKNKKSNQSVVNLVRHPKKTVPDDDYLLNKIGHLWLYGIKIDWNEFYAGEKRYRVPLPTYPFEGQPYRTDGDLFKMAGEMLYQKPHLNTKKDLADFFYIPLWKQSVSVLPGANAVPGQTTWLVFANESGLSEQLVKKLGKQAGRLITVKKGAGFEKISQQEFTINPCQANDYNTLLSELHALDTIPQTVVHLWSVTGNNEDPADMEDFAGVQYSGFYSLVYLAQATRKKGLTTDFQITVVSNNIQEVSGEEILYPAKACVLAPVKIIPQEFTNIICRSIDVDISEPGSPGENEPGELVDRLLTEISTGSADTMVAYRKNRRWVQIFDAVKLEENRELKIPLRKRGVYLVTGGLGNIGMILAEYLAGNFAARLILTGRSPLPGKEAWAEWLSTHGEQDDTSRKIRKLQEIESLGAEVMFSSADAADQTRMQQVIELAEKRFGNINGIIHAAGIIKGNSCPCAIENISAAECEEQFNPKVYGLLVLHNIFKDKKLDFCLLTSSLSAILGGLGFTCYAAANIFMDFFVKKHCRGSNPGWISVDWDGWQGEDKSPETLAITPGEGKLAFERILAWGKENQVIVSTRDLQSRFDRWIKFEIPRETSDDSTAGISSLKARPEITTPYVPYRTPVEQTITGIWQKFFGIERIGIQDDFFELGGDSLKAMTILAKIHKALHVIIPLTEFFNRPIIKSLAAYINNTKKSEFYSIKSAEKKEYYALSSAQKRLYILQQMDNKTSTAYNTPLIRILEGDIDLPRLEDTFRQLVTRHEILRTSFHSINDEPVQKVDREVAFGINDYTPAGKATKKIIRDFLKPFDLSKAPLMRVGLIKENEKRAIVMFDIHHIITDGVSTRVFAQDFLAAYSGEELPGLRLQYKDFAGYQAGKHGKSNLHAQESYWLNRFTGEMPVLSLPLDFARPVKQGFAGETIHFTIEKEKAGMLKDLALKEEVSLFMLLLTAFNLLLAKVSGSEDIVIGTGIDGRRHEDIREIIGLFINTLALRNFPRPNKNFREFLGELKADTLKAFENQDYPFEELVEKVAVKRDISRNPLFDVMFQLNNYELPELVIPGHKLKPYPYSKKVSKFDLTLWAWEETNRLSFAFEYSTKLFKRETIDIFTRYFNEILAAVTANPDRKLSEIKRISRESKEEILAQMNKGVNEEARIRQESGQILQHRVKENLEKFANKVAIEYGTSALTYGELDKRSNRTARRITGKGMTKETFIGVLIDDRMELICAALGILKANGVFVPLDATLPQARLEMLIRSTGIKSLIVDKPNAQTLAAGALLKSRELELFPVEAGIEDEVKSQPLQSLYTRYRPDDKIYIYFTSGSTGTPKAILGKNSSLLHFIDWEIDTFNIDSDFRFGQLANPGFDAFLRDVFVPLCCGGTICIPESKDILLNAPKFLDWMEQSGINLVSLVPALFRLFAANPLTPANLTRLKVILLSGERITPPDLEVWFATFAERIELVNLWGTSETTLAKTYHLLKKTAGDRERIPVGKPIKGAAVMALDDNGELCDRLVIGELYIYTPSRSFGYCNDPQLTAERFIPHPFADDPSARLHKTGDFGRILADGSIDLLGRNDRQVKIRGIRIELEEIENILQKQPLVEEAVVIKKESTNHNELLCAYFTAVKTPGTAVNSFIDTIKAYLREKLPDYMVPNNIVKLEKIPRNLNGKVDYKALNALEIETGAYIPPENNTERKLAKLWTEILKIEKIGITDHFFQLGGNSLNTMSLISRIHREFGIRISLGDMFEHPTIRTQAKIINAAGQEQFTPVIAVEKKEYYPLSYAQGRIYTALQFELGSTSYNMTTMLRLLGELDRNHLQETFRKLIARHESLRTSFEIIRNEPMQKLLDRVEFSIEYLDFGEKTTDLRNYIRAFDVTQAPLLRVCLLRTGDREHAMMVDISHILSDGVSSRILAKDFMTLYNRQELPPLEIQYKDFSEWQSGLFRTAKIKQQEDSWLEVFKGDLHVLDLPTDFPRPDVRSVEAGDIVNADLEEPLKGKIYDIIRETNTTLFTFLLAVYNVLLNKYTGQEDIVVGSVVTGRTHGDLQNVIGVFINMLPLRNWPRPGKHFRDFLVEVKENTLSAFENQDYPLEELVKKLGIRSKSGRHPLFDTEFALDNIDNEEIEIPGLRMEQYGSGSKFAKFDLHFLAVELNHSIKIFLRYSTELFKRSTSEIILKHYEKIIKQVVDNQDIKLEDIRVLMDFVPSKSNISQKGQGDFIF